MNSLFYYSITHFIFFPVCFPRQLYPTMRSGVGSCPRITEDSDIFGNRADFSNQGLLSTSFISGDENSPLTLKILRARLLSEAIGLKRNTASSVSFLLQYLLPGNGAPRLAQVTMDCILDQYNPAVEYSFYPSPDPTSNQSVALDTARVSVGSVLRTIGITATFSTEPEYACGQCGLQTGMVSNPVTQCICKYNAVQNVFLVSLVRVIYSM